MGQSRSRAVVGAVLDGETIGLSSAQRGFVSATKKATKRLSAVALDFTKRDHELDTTHSPEDTLTCRVVADDDYRDMKSAQKALQMAEGQRFSICMSSSGQLVAACGTSGSVMVWNVVTGHVVLEAKNPYGSCNSVCLSADGSRVAYIGRDGRAKVHDIGGRDASPRIFLASGKSYLRRVTLDHNGRTLLACAQDGTLQMFEVDRGTCIGVVPAHRGTAWGVQMNNMGSHAVTCGADGVVGIWDLQTLHRVKHFDDSREMTPAKFWCVSMSSNVGNMVVAAAAEDCSVRVWNMNSQLQVAKLKHQQWIWSVAVSVSGDRVAACGGHLIYVWDVQSSRIIQCFHVPQAAWVWSVSLGDSDVAALSSDGTVWIWDIEEASVKRTLKLP
mmetsp:Transcript_28534/g.66114  ORF Transcript_28534/g.66114 Transcript_28534/m.66114 type:complete len:386 (+) Transcript_28534:103-1260(+)